MRIGSMGLRWTLKEVAGMVKHLSLWAAPLVEVDWIHHHIATELLGAEVRRRLQQTTLAFASVVVR